MDFPELVGAAIERLQLPGTEELGEQIGYTQSAISKWMRRQQMPSRTRWQQIADGMGVTVEEVATAIANTKVVKSPSLAAQLRQCRRELEQARQENARLRQVQGGR